MMITVDQGLLSIRVENVLLNEVLKRIKEQAGFKLVLYGGKLKATVTASFVNVPLDEGLRRLVEKHSISITYNITDVPERSKKLETIREIWVFNSDGNPNQTVVIEPSPGKSQEPVISYETSHALPLTEENDEAEGQSLEPTEADPESGYWEKTLSTTSDHLLRVQAISELQQIGSDTAVAAIATVFGEDNVALRKHAATSLAYTENEKVVPVLAQILLGDKDPTVRLEAVLFFTRRHNNVSHSFLRIAAKDSDKNIQTVAKEALAAY